MNGKVKFFDRTRGFGFITGDDGKEYFVHQTALGEGATLNENDAVTFEVEEGDRGPKAVSVAKGDAAPAEEASEEVAEDVAEEPAEEADEEVADDTVEEPAEEASEEVAEDAVEEAPAEEEATEEAEEPAEEEAAEEATEDAE